TVWHDYLQPGNAWSGWGKLPTTATPALVGDVSVGYNNGGFEELFARDSSGTVWHNYLGPANAWSGWGKLPTTATPALVGNVSVGYNNDPIEELFARDSSGTVWHNYLFEPNNQWSGWSKIPTTNTPSLVSDVGTRARR